jgi:hypothetical protein
MHGDRIKIVNLIHFLIEITHCKAITFRQFDVPLSSVKVKRLTLVDSLDKYLSCPFHKADNKHYIMITVRRQSNSAK